MPLPAIAATLVGGFATFLIAKISSGHNARTVRQEPQPLPVVPKAPPVVSVPKVPVKEPPPAPVDVAPPPKAPPPPVDPSPVLPTPPTPREEPLPPVVVAKPPPVVPVAKEPPPAPVDVAPPPPTPAPPHDPDPRLPLPPGAFVDVPVGDKYTDYAATNPNAIPAPSKPAPIAPAPSGPPAGFDATLASTLAPGVAANIAQKQYDFDRAQLKRFQTAAGVASDGVYGDDTWGALLYFTSDAPRALYKPNLPTPYPWGKFVSGMPTTSAEPPPARIDATAPPATPSAPADTQSAQVGPVPPAGFNPASAKKLAKQVAANIDSKGKASYSRTLLKQFQTAAGLVSDGLYGGASRRALIFYGVPRPPVAAFAPVAMPDEYPWASQAQAAS